MDPQRLNLGVKRRKVASDPHISFFSEAEQLQWKQPKRLLSTRTTKNIPTIAKIARTRAGGGADAAREHAKHR